MSTHTFAYSSSCELEVHSSPFGLSGVYIKVARSEAIGIGSTMARLSGFTTGNVYYNSPDDLINTKYKVYGLLEDDDILRIDFIKIFLPKNPTPSDNGNLTSPESSNLHAQADSQDLPIESPDDAGYETPDLVFRGKIPAGRPEVVEPFIGIFNFEKPPSS